MYSKEEILKSAFEQFDMLRNNFYRQNVNKECYEGSGGGSWHLDFSFKDGLSKDEIEKECNEALALCEEIYEDEPSKKAIEYDKENYYFDCMWEYEGYYFALHCSYAYNRDEYDNNEISVTWGVD